MKRGIVPQTAQLLFHCRACSSTAAATVVPKKASTKKKTEDRVYPTRDDLKKFEKHMAVKLHRTFHEEQLKVKAAMNKRHAETQVTRMANRKDYISLLAFVCRVRENQKKHSVNAISDELITVCLLSVQQALRQCDPNSRDALALFLNSSNLIVKLSFVEYDTRFAVALLLDAMEQCRLQRTTSESRKDIDEALEGVRAKFAQMAKALRMKPDRVKLNRMYFDENDWKVVLAKLGEVSEDEAPTRSVFPEENRFNYDQDLRIVANLNTPVSQDEYYGNPFYDLGISKEQYLAMFEEQLDNEQTHSLKVKNFVRKSKKISAEKLIEKWQWKEAIENNLTKSINFVRDAGLKNYISILPIPVIADSIMKTVHAELNTGKNLTSLYSFELNLVNPLITMIQNKFLASTVTNKRELARDVYEKYIDYFLNDEIARNYTAREWWSRCAEEVKVRPEFDFPFAEADRTTQKALGAFLQACVIESCKFPMERTSSRLNPGRVEQIESVPAFSFHDVLAEEESKLLDEEHRVNLSKMLKINANMLQVLEEHEFEFLRFPCNELPLKVPPRPWLDGGSGGPQFTKGENVLREADEYKKVDLNEQLKLRLKTRSQARPVFDALNDLGSTPWRVNKKMLKTLQDTFAMSGDAKNQVFLSTVGIPLCGDAVKVPDFIERFGSGVRKENIDPNAWRAYAKEKHEAMKSRDEQNSMWCWLMYRLVLADHFKDDVLFFPHNMDFRGRVYPTSPFLSHMGDDINRSILKFAKGKPLGSGGLDWLKLHCINLTGKLKRQSIATRMLHVQEILPDLIDSAERPLDGKQWWTQSDDPWQTLAACVELRDAIYCDNPSNFISHLPIHQDGSCNGLQHYAALGRDRQGGAEVNLLPSELPSDVYSSVAARVELKRIEDEKSQNDEVREVALALREAMPNPVERKVIKQTVMTTVYGVTKYGATQQILKQLKALDMEHEGAKKFATYLTAKTFVSLHDAFTSSMELKDWFRRAAQVIVSLMRSVEWVTPLGLPVYQPYLRVKSKHGRLILLPAPTKQINAFPPNFVHSLDSTHMMLTALNCRRKGITFAAVHDCYWTHCGTVNEMNEICRDQFISLYKEPIVEQMSEFMKKTYLPTDVRLHLPEADYERTVKVFSPELKAGDLDIESVRDSIYFFS